LQNIIPIIELRRIRREGHVAHLGRREMPVVFLCKNQKCRDILEDLGIDGW
jgi:hypothetical protein